ncbi:hypothetical protein [Intrasporangium sp. DVR]|uniref:hypothetical protein n=1 Tax=Intrasporangium sp. DVR TaxID=3127867 RepID=UPI00313A74DC
MRPESVTDPPLDLAEVTRAVLLLEGLLGPVPVLSLSVERDLVTVPPPRGSSMAPELQQCVTVRLHCQDDQVAAEVGNRLGLGAGLSRTFPARYNASLFVESRWTGWLTEPVAASLEVPVSLTLLGSHLEPAPLDEGEDVLAEAVA